MSSLRTRLPHLLEFLAPSARAVPFPVRDASMPPEGFEAHLRPKNRARLAAALERLRPVLVAFERLGQFPNADQYRIARECVHALEDGMYHAQEWAMDEEMLRDPQMVATRPASLTRSSTPEYHALRVFARRLGIAVGIAEDLAQVPVPTFAVARDRRASR